MKLISFKEELHQNLRDVEYATVYLEGALEDSPKEFLYALRELATAHGAVEIEEVIARLIEAQDRRRAERDEWVERGSQCG